MLKLLCTWLSLSLLSMLVLTKASIFLPEFFIHITPINELWYWRITGMEFYLWSLTLWPNDVIWRQGSRSTLAQVLACCLMAPSHYLNQCWLMISEVLWHSPDSNFKENTWDICHWNEIEIYQFETVVKSPRGQWVKLIQPPATAINIRCKEIMKVVQIDKEMPDLNIS